MPLSSANRILKGRFRISDVRCERDEICCGEDDLPQPCDGRLFPPYLTMTLAGYGSPDVCHFDVDDIADVHGASSGDLVGANTWANGSYRLKRVSMVVAGTSTPVTGATYILADSGFLIQPGTTRVVRTTTGGTAVNPDLDFTTIEDTISGRSGWGIFPTGLVPGSFEQLGLVSCSTGLSVSDLMVALGQCGYAPDCAFDYILNCGLASLTGGAAAAFIAAGASTWPAGWDVVQRHQIWPGPTTSYAASMFAMLQPMTFKQALITLVCDAESYEDIGCGGATYVQSRRSFVKTDVIEWEAPDGIETTVTTGRRAQHTEGYTNPLYPPGTIVNDTFSWVGGNFSMSVLGAGGEQLDLSS